LLDAGETLHGARAFADAGFTSSPQTKEQAFDVSTLVRE